MLALLVLIPACGSEWKPPEKAKRVTDDRPLTDSSGAPALGSETDGSRAPTYGKGTVTEDTYLCPRGTDSKSFARARLCRENPQGDIDTFEKRVSEGRISEIASGTEVFLRGVVNVTANGEIFKFQRVEVADGSLTDKDGYPARGRVLADYVSQ